MTRLGAVAAALALTACAAPEPERRVVRVPEPVSPPAALLECAGKPTKPAGEYTQRDVAAYVLDLAEAHSDCRGKLSAVRRFVDEVTEKKEIQK